MPVLLSLSSNTIKQEKYYPLQMQINHLNSRRRVHHMGLSEAGNSLLSSNSQVNKSDSSLLTKDQEIQAGIPALI